MPTADSSYENALTGVIVVTVLTALINASLTVISDISAEIIITGRENNETSLIAKYLLLSLAKSIAVLNKSDVAKYPTTRPIGIANIERSIPSVTIIFFICFFVAPIALIFPYSCIFRAIPIWNML